MEETYASNAHPLTCPFCEVHELESQGQNVARCGSCGGLVSGAFLETIYRIRELPDALGSHACECGHPEMRKLPDGTFHCPACGSEVVPPVQRDEQPR
jgi:ribosomal protein L37AE/L43A